MKSLRRAATRFRDAGSIPVLAALLVIAASAPLAAGERSRPSDTSGRTAEPRGSDRAPSSSPPPSYSPPPSSGSGSGSRGSENRTAVPRSGGGGNDNEPSRQRPHGTVGGGGGGGGSYYRGGHYYPYYGPRFYPYYGPYWGWGWGSWWWGDDPYYWGHGSYYGRYRDRYDDRYGTLGALDIDVSPGKTEVWIDGRYTGTADDFDGFPQYLWLDRGVYDLVLFREGYATIARQITIRPGQVVSMGDRLQPGESVRPEDLATKTHDRRDERVTYEEKRREEIARRDSDGMDDWRERARRRMEERDRYEDDEEGRPVAGEDGVSRLRLDIEPSDASVYLDGRFVGTGADLQRLRVGLRLEPGEHRIAVVRPGHKAEEQEFTVAVGEEVELEFDLESE